VAVAGIAWLLRRSGRERDAALDAQRAALERLRGDLAELVSDAEARARALEETLGARERRLRALVAESGRLEAARDAAPRVEAPPRLRIDPAEARLLRDLERA
jgi:hypothetical protein